MIIKFFKKLFRKVSSTSMIKKVGTYDHIITINYNNGDIEKFEGSCTVWYSLKNGKRCGTLKEGYLNRIWNYHNSKNEK